MCEQCDAIFDTAARLQMHTEAVHGPEEPGDALLAEVRRIRYLLTGILVALVAILVVLLDRLPQEINVTAF